MRKRDIHVSISHSEGFHESTRRGNGAKFNIEKGAQERGAMVGYRRKLFVWRWRGKRRRGTGQSEGVVWLFFAGGLATLTLRVHYVHHFVHSLWALHNTQ